MKICKKSYKKSFSIKTKAKHIIETTLHANSFKGTTPSKIHSRKENIWRSSNDPIELGWKKVVRNHFTLFTMG